jgi:hypothetical protein
MRPRRRYPAAWRSEREVMAAMERAAALAMSESAMVRW